MAAGLGFKTFNTGDVLTAADTNGYLMQGVWVFANSTARTSAVTSPQEGNVSFLKDTNSFEIYDGTAWVAYGSGDITGVTAGTGISGGGTSGTVTITNSMATEITAAGDIIVGTGSGTFDNLPIGTTGQVLTADTTVSPYKVKWAAAGGSSGGMTLISTTSASSSTSIVISSIPTTYKNLQIIIRNLKTSVDNPQVYMRLNGNTGSVYREMTANDGGQAFNQTYFQLDPGGGADSGTSQGLAVIEIPDYANTTTWKLVSSMFLNNNGDITTLLQYKKAHGFMSNITDAITSVTFLLNSGNMTSGDFLLYGVK